MDIGDGSMNGLDGRSHCRGYELGETKTFLDGQRLAADDHDPRHVTTQAGQQTNTTAGLIE